MQTAFGAIAEAKVYSDVFVMRTIYNTIQHQHPIYFQRVSNIENK